ncbi:MmgE/PrpD family protein [Azohydromonas australica]|uniref:MmgE/PrpD family protein n=1 Tax=Azohydromonas australica TaxID=364039 RepID=UPI0005BB0344
MYLIERADSALANGRHSGEWRGRGGPIQRAAGPQATFEGADGFLRVYLRGQCDSQALRDGLGRRCTFPQVGFKPCPCCRPNHTAISAALALQASIAAACRASGACASA